MEGLVTRRGSEVKNDGGLNARRGLVEDYGKSGPGRSCLALCGPQAPEWKSIIEFTEHLRGYLRDPVAD